MEYCSGGGGGAARRKCGFHSRSPLWYIMHFHIQSLTDHSHWRLDASQLPSVSLFTCEAPLADSLSYFWFFLFFPFFSTFYSAGSDAPQSEDTRVCLSRGETNRSETRESTSIRCGIHSVDLMLRCYYASLVSVPVCNYTLPERETNDVKSLKKKPIQWFNV